MDNQPADNQQPQQPGQVIAPGAPTSQPEAPAPAPPAPPVVEQTAPVDSQTPDEPEASAAADDAIEWTASEFINHEKSSGWYLRLAVAAVAVAVGLFLITGDIITSAVVLVGAAFLGFYGARKPRQLRYRLDNHGISIGEKHFAYGEFRSFSVIPEGAFSSIMLMPLKRFAPTLSIYYAPEHEDEIAAVLSQQLPYQERQPDAVDRLMRKIRF